MKNAIIIQQVHSGSEYANMLRLTYARHCEYAMKHGFDFIATMANIPRDAPVDPRNNKIPLGAWAKLFLVRDALRNGYEFVIWLDADTLIVDLKTDLRDAFKEMSGDIGMCQHPNPTHFNVGVMFFRNSERVLQFMDEWIAHMHAPGEQFGWQEQGWLNQLVKEEKWKNILSRIDDKWNATHYAGTDQPDAAIRGYHGAEGITPRMRYQALQGDLTSLI